LGNLATWPPLPPPSVALFVSENAAFSSLEAAVSPFVTAAALSSSSGLFTDSDPIVCSVDVVVLPL
jgi:hypothetical protein